MLFLDVDIDLVVCGIVLQGEFHQRDIVYCGPMEMKRKSTTKEKRKETDHYDQEQAHLLLTAMKQHFTLPVSLFSALLPNDTPPSTRRGRLQLKKKRRVCVFHMYDHMMAWLGVRHY